jgi:hypothetical protein
MIQQFLRIFSSKNDLFFSLVATTNNYW